jgi:hypothetical protein
VANVLAGKDYMDCVAMNMGSSEGGFEGVSLENFIKGKRKYIEEKVPSVTIYKAQSDFLPMAMVDNQHKRRLPSFDFMFRELAHGEDVEIVVGRYQRPAMGPPIRLSGHVLTLTELEWHDEGPGGIGDFQFGPDDFAKMTFIDPLGGITDTAEIRLLGDRLATGYDAGGAGNLRAIDAVVSESPGAVPEPGAALLLAWGLYAYAARRRSRDLERDR